MGIDKRQQERVFVSLAIVLDFSSGSREARISDISMGGCFVDSIAKVVENETLSFKLNLDSEHSIKFYGKVTYVYPGVGFGLEFIHLTEAEIETIRQIIIEHGGKVSEPLTSQIEEDASAELEISVQTEDSPDSKKASFDEIMQSIREMLDNKDKK